MLLKSSVLFFLFYKLFQFLNLADCRVETSRDSPLVKVIWSLPLKCGWISLIYCVLTI